MFLKSHCYLDISNTTAVIIANNNENMQYTDKDIKERRKQGRKYSKSLVSFVPSSLLLPVSVSS